MSVIIPTSSSSSQSPLSHATTMASTQSSPAMSLPTTHVHDSTLPNTLDSTTTSQLDRTQPSDQPGKLGLSLYAPHPAPPASSPIQSGDALPASHTASSNSIQPDHASTSAAVPVPMSIDSVLRSAEHGVSPIINAFRSPYPPSPSYFVTVVPPDDYPISPQSSQHERDRLQRGSLLPLYPTLGGQLWAISREFALPSLGGLMLYLADDGQGNRGPRIGDAAWQALWFRYFAEDEAPSTSAYKGATTFTPSRRSSTVAADSVADPSSSTSPLAVDLSRSTLAEASSSRPTIPYVSLRPSPRLEALGFPRRDASAEWSPSVRSAAWSAHASSSAGRVPIPVAPFPRLPILARIEWQVDSNKAPWWPTWIATRTAGREQRPSHKTRKSMHLANASSQMRDDELGTDDDEVHQAPQPTSRGLEPNTQEIQPESSQPMEPKPPAVPAPSPIQAGLPESQIISDATPLAIPEAEHRDLDRSLEPLSPALSLREADAVSEAPVVETPAAFEEPQDAKLVEPACGRASPSDEPLRSARASIVSMGSIESRRTTSTSRVPAEQVFKRQIVVPSSSSIGTRSRSPSPLPRLESSATLLNQNDASDQSRTGYSEILDAGDADEQDTQHDGSISREPLSLAQEGDYSALPDSPSLEAHEPFDRPAASEHEQDFPCEAFPLRYSFIVDVGDEAMWRDLQHHGMDQIFPEPREPSETLPPQNQPHESSRSLEDAHPEAHANDFEMVHRSDYDEVAYQQHPAHHLWSSSAAMQTTQDLPHSTLVHADSFAHDAYHNPQRSNMARIQSWIGKTPTGRLDSTGGFEDDFGRDVDEDGLQLPQESEIDEVVGLWASKIREDPYGVPLINGPTASVNGDDDDTSSVVQEVQHRAVEHREGEASLDAAPAPAISLLSPIHLDAAAFDGVRPQLGNLTVPLSPQLLCPTAIGDAFNTPRASSPGQRSVSTHAVQQHPSPSPSSLAPPQGHSPSSASRRSSGDLSDTLEEMQKALELLSPGCSPNPGGSHSPNSSAPKMSSRDSLAYARSLSASVTPSPKWFARAKAATVKSRINARSTFAAGGSPFDREQVSPRPASTSAVSSSCARSPGFRAPFSASRLMEFSKADTLPRLARTEVGDADSIRSRDTTSDGVTESTAVPFAHKHAAPDIPSSGPSSQRGAGELVQAESVSAITPRMNELELDSVEHATLTTLPVEQAEIVAEVASHEPDEPDTASVAAPESHAQPAPSAPASETEGEDTEELAAFMGDDHEHGFASIQRFLRGKVASRDSDASIPHDLSAAVTDQLESSTDGTIIERSGSLESDSQSATPGLRTDVAEPSHAAEEVEELPVQPAACANREETGSKERWSQVSDATGNFSSHHPSAYSLNSNSPKRDLLHDVRTRSFTYDAHLSSEPTTADTQLSTANVDGEGLSVAGEVVKSYMSSSPSDEAFFISSGRSGTALSQERQSSDGIETDEGTDSVIEHQQLPIGEHSRGDAVDHQEVSVADPAEQHAASPSIPVLAYKFASSPVHQDMFTVKRPLTGSHDDSLDEEEIRAMNEDTRAAVREALSQSTAHHANILPAVAPISSSAPLSPRSSTSPTSPLSSHSSLGDQFRRRGSASSLNLTSTGGGSGRNTSSPNFTSTNTSTGRRKPAKLNIDIDGVTLSRPAAASARRLPSTSPRSRFGQLPPSPSLHPSFKAAASSSLNQSFAVMGMGSPQGKGFLPSLASVTSIENELAG